jgi:tetratricopeptide (TPR) repeat protein
MKNLAKAFLISGVVILSACSQEQAGKSTAQQQQPQAALEIARQNATKYPTFENQINYGLALHNAGRENDAVSAFESAILADPKNPVGHNNVCSTRNNMQQWALAIPECEAALKLQPDWDLAKNNLAASRAALTEDDKRLAPLFEHLHGPDGEKTRFELGFRLYQRGSYEQALEVWKATSKSSPFYADTMNDIATIYILTKNYAGAKTALEAAIHANPGNQLYRNNASWLASASGNRVQIQ